MIPGPGSPVSYSRIHLFSTSLHGLTEVTSLQLTLYSHRAHVCVLILQGLGQLTKLFELWFPILKKKKMGGVSTITLLWLFVVLKSQYGDSLNGKLG